MDELRVVYKVYSPEGIVVRIYSTRRLAQAFIDGLNYNTPSWQYDKLYKRCADVVHIDSPDYAKIWM